MNRSGERGRPRAAGFLTAALLTLLWQPGAAALSILGVAPRAMGGSRVTTRALRSARVYRSGTAGRARRAGRPPASRALTTAPGVTVRSLSPHRALVRKRIEEFDLSPRGGIVVRIGGALYDFASGQRLTNPGQPVRSFAFVQGALAVVTERDTLGFWKDGGMRDAGKVPYGARRLRSSESGNQLLLIGDTPDSGVFRFSTGASLRPVCGAPARILTAAGEGDHCLVAIGGSLYDVPEPGALSLRMALPEGKGEIVGLSLAGDVTYFATTGAVSSLQGGLAIPLAVGIGGPMRRTVRGLLVLDRKTGTLYRLSGSGLTGPGRTVATRRKSRPVSGTLQLTLSSADREADASQYTLYVDGKFLSPFTREAPTGWQNPRLLPLSAGRHRVEVAVKLPGGEEDTSFPFKFQSAEVEIPAGGTASVTLDVGTAYAFAWASSSYPEDGPSQSWFDGFARSVRETQYRVSDDRVVAALVEAGHRVGRQAPSRQRLRLDLPEHFGGVREYDAEQVQLIAQWLPRYHWSWASRLPDTFVNRMSDGMRQEYELLLEEIEREKSRLVKLGKPGELANRMR